MQEKSEKIEGALAQFKKKLYLCSRKRKMTHQLNIFGLTFEHF